jgi:hypothetical protein
MQPRTIQQVSTLQEVMSRWGHSHLRKGLWIDNSGDWIVESAANSGLIICHDGSYMPDLDPTRCAAAVVFLCRHTGKLASVTHCETTAEDTASNYRGELIGGALATLVLLAVEELNPSQKAPPCHIYCDNLGVVTHGNLPYRSLPEKQVQMDILSLFRRNLSTLTQKVVYTHVYGHVDEVTAYAQLSLPEQLNVMADHLAKQALITAVTTGSVRGPTYPREAVRIKIGDRKSTSSIRRTLYEHWGNQVGKALFQRRRIVSEHNYGRIAWAALGRAMDMYPQMYRTWVTKHVSGFSGTNRQLSRTEGGPENRCPCCLCPDESAAHITRCKNAGRLKMFKATVDTLLDWMETTSVDIDVVECMEEYFKHQGEMEMREIAAPYEKLHEWAIEHDILGWDNFLEGRIGNVLLSMQQARLNAIGSRTHISTWATGFIRRILDITHKQWLYRNARLHICLQEGKTIEEHDFIMDQVGDMLLTDPDTLLPQHQHLLDSDFSKLGEGTSADRQYWLEDMKTAVQASRRVNSMVSNETNL